MDANAAAAPSVVASPKSDHSFDVVIVGSGASGGWAAKRLTEAGLRVAVLEAGRALTDADYKEHVQPPQLKYRGRTKTPFERTQPQQSQSYAVREWNATGTSTTSTSRTWTTPIRSSCGCVRASSAAA